jgi:hypothetical protein
MMKCKILKEILLNFTIRTDHQGATSKRPRLAPPPPPHVYAPVPRPMPTSWYLPQTFTLPPPPPPSNTSVPAPPAWPMPHTLASPPQPASTVAQILAAQPNAVMPPPSLHAPATSQAMTHQHVWPNVTQHFKQRGPACPVSNYHVPAPPPQLLPVSNGTTSNQQVPVNGLPYQPVAQSNALGFQPLDMSNRTLSNYQIPSLPTQPLPMSNRTLTNCQVSALPTQALLMVNVTPSNQLVPAQPTQRLPIPHGTQLNQLVLPLPSNPLPMPNGTPSNQHVSAPPSQPLSMPNGSPPNQLVPALPTPPVPMPIGTLANTQAPTPLYYPLPMPNKTPSNQQVTAKPIKTTSSWSSFSNTEVDSWIEDDDWCNDLLVSTPSICIPQAPTPAAAGLQVTSPKAAPDSSQPIPSTLKQADDVQMIWKSTRTLQSKAKTASATQDAAPTSTTGQDATQTISSTSKQADDIQLIWQSCGPSQSALNSASANIDTSLKSTSVQDATQPIPSTSKQADDVQLLWQSTGIFQSMAKTASETQNVLPKCTPVCKTTQPITSTSKQSDDVELLWESINTPSFSLTSVNSKPVPSGTSWKQRPQSDTCSLLVLTEGPKEPGPSTVPSVSAVPESTNNLLGPPASSLFSLVLKPYLKSPEAASASLMDPLESLSNSSASNKDITALGPNGVLMTPGSFTPESDEPDNPQASSSSSSVLKLKIQHTGIWPVPSASLVLGSSNDIHGP